MDVGHGHGLDKGEEESPRDDAGCAANVEALLAVSQTDFHFRELPL